MTLVVPVKNEQASLHEFWSSVARQQTPPAEIVIVEAGSADRSSEILDEIRASDRRVRIVSAPGAYPGTARNAGIEAAEHPIVALADCGTTLSPAWLEELVRAFDDRCDVVYGTFEPLRDGRVARWIDVAFLPQTREREGGRNRGETLRSLLLTKEVWSRVGGFPPWRAAEDLEFLGRLRDPGIERGFAPRSVAFWRPPSTVGETFRKLSLYSRHNVWAGRQGEWHHGMVRTYAVSVGIGTVAWLLRGRRGSATRSIGASLGLSLLARTARRIWQARHTERPAVSVASGDAVGVALMIIVGDAATLLGWLTALTRPRPSVYQ